MAKLGHTLRGAATGPLPSLAIRGGPTPGGGCTPALLGAGPSLAIGLWATGLPLATYWPSGEGPLATDWPPTPTGHPLRGGHPPLWPLTGHWLHHTGSGATPPAPLGRRGLWPKREPHTTGGGASLWPTGYNPLATPIGEAPLHGQRGVGLRLLATYWPYREASHRPPTGHKGAAIGGRPSHLPSLATYSPSPHRPIEGFGRDGQKQGSPPYTDLLTGHLLATYDQKGPTPDRPLATMGPLDSPTSPPLRCLPPPTD